MFCWLSPLRKQLHLHYQSDIDVRGNNHTFFRKEIETSNKLCGGNTLSVIDNM
jgi:hypothetical protein